MFTIYIHNFIYRHMCCVSITVYVCTSCSGNLAIFSVRFKISLFVNVALASRTENGNHGFAS